LTPRQTPNPFSRLTVIEVLGRICRLMTGKISALGVNPFEKVQLAWIDAEI
jgi:hypothetical protein